MINIFRNSGNHHYHDYVHNLYCTFVDFDIVNHPVHIISKDNHVSPSAFIPFCEFGGNMTAMGVKVDQFEIPVCNVFKAKILMDQVCFEVDLQEFSDKNNIDKELELGFNFIMDYNEDRMVSFNRFSSNKEPGLASNMVESDKNKQAFIYLDTIGK